MKLINKHQLFTMMVIFQIGSTTLFVPGIGARQDVWIAIIIATIIAIGFAWIYTELQRMFPEKNYVEIIISILGKWMGVPLSLLYAVYWLWPTVRILRDCSELFVLTYLPNTPLDVIIITFIITSVYVLLLGVKTLARTTEITTPIVIFFIIYVFIMVFISGNVDIRNLSPILSRGIKPLFMAAYPSVVAFPFGFTLVFSMYWKYVDDKSAIREITFKAILFSGTLLCITSIVYVIVLGVNYISTATIPFVVLIKMINVGEFITNLDSIGATIIFLGGFYMMSVFFNGFVMVLVTIFKVKKYNLFLVLVAVFITWVSIVFEPSYTYHLWMYPFDTYYFHSIFLQGIPALLLLICWIKAKLKKK